MQKIRKILIAVSEKTALPTNQATKQPTNQLLPTDLADASPTPSFHIFELLSYIICCD